MNPAGKKWLRLKVNYSTGIPAGNNRFIPNRVWVKHRAYDIIFIMVDLAFLREKLTETAAGIARKGVIPDTELFVALDSRRRELIVKSETLQSNRNRLAKEIGRLKKAGLESTEPENESSRLALELEQLKSELKEVERQFQDFLLNLPNIPEDSVPDGRDAADNQLVRSWGEKPVFPFRPRPHWELQLLQGSLDFPRAGKLAGARFALSFGSMARLERVLISFMVDIHSRENGYTEVWPPFLANSESLVSTGNLPKFKEDLFKIEDCDLYLVPTAEVPLTNIHRDEVLAWSELPRRYVAYTPCFRSEAGSHGRDVRGLVRQHQFNKVEMMVFARPADSAAELEKMTGDAEKILRLLELPFRTVLLCSGDMSFASARTYDIEVWMPGRDAYLEISSCSNTAAFQARRSRIKYRDQQGKKDFLHTLNGSGLAVGRTVAAILENYQCADGRVRIPEVLRCFFPDQEFF